MPREKVLKLSNGTKLILGIYGVILIAILGIMIAVAVVGVSTRNDMLSEFSKDNMQAMLDDALAQLQLEEMINGALTNPANAQALLAAVTLALNGRSIDEERSSISANTRSVVLVFSESLNARSITDNETKRSASAICPSIPDEPVCNTVDSMCKQLRKCISSANSTECFAFGYRAIDVCNTQNF